MKSAWKVTVEDADNVETYRCVAKSGEKAMKKCLRQAKADGFKDPEVCGLDIICCLDF